MVKDIYFLTRQILRYRLERRPDTGEEAALSQNFLKYGSIYVVADPNTSKQEWESKTFGIAIEDKTIHLFIEREDALIYAKQIGSVLFDGTFMVMKASQAMVKSLVNDYAQKGFIGKIWLCGKSPIRAKVGVDPFVKGVKKEGPSTIMETSKPAPAPPEVREEEPVVEDEPASPSAGLVLPENLVLVDEVRKVLSEPNAAERRKIDPSGSYLNFHLLMEELINTNKIDPVALDYQFGLTKGFTANLMSDITGCNVPMKIIGQYLKYFGLFEFLYLFKGQSVEMSEFLKKTPGIDLYEIKRATTQATERFKLMSVNHAQNNGINIYKLTFLSDLREQTLISSTNIDMVIGRDYTINGLEPAPNSSTTLSDKNAASSSLSAIPTEEEMEAKLKELEQKEASKKKKGQYPAQERPPQKKDPRMTGKTRYMAETPEEKMEKDTQTVLQYLIKTKSIGEREARKLMVPFDDDQEVMASFASYITSKNSDNKFGRLGYTPRRLMRNLMYSPLEAFSIMARLQKKPKETLQELKYRETEPQYQKAKPEPKD